MYFNRLYPNSKDAEKILETFKDIISENKPEENENNISKVKTKN